MFPSKCGRSCRLPAGRLLRRRSSQFLPDDERAVRLQRLISETARRCGGGGGHGRTASERRTVSDTPRRSRNNGVQQKLPPPRQGDELDRMAADTTIQSILGGGGETDLLNRWNVSGRRGTGAAPTTGIGSVYALSRQVPVDRVVCMYVCKHLLLAGLHIWHKRADFSYHYLRS